jgi:Protein of unknown function (DUF2630)
MSDQQARARIEELEQEERRLRRDEGDAAHRDASRQVADDAARLGEIRVELDRLWDYVRQRRALRDSGGNPDDAELRPGPTVEGYLG